MKGFTLTELLVSIAIFTIISMAAFVNLRGGSGGRELRAQSNNLVSLLRQAQVQSLAGQPFQGSAPIGGYGVHVATCAAPPCLVQLFADVNSNFRYDSGELVQDVQLGAATIASTSQGSSLDVIFKPPRPFVCFNGVCSGIDTATITLGNTSNSQTTDITINQVSGQISSQ